VRLTGLLEHVLELETKIKSICYVAAWDSKELYFTVFGSLFYDAFLVTRLYSVNDRVAPGAGFTGVDNNSNIQGVPKVALSKSQI
jgi:hypothetical protein